MKASTGQEEPILAKFRFGTKRHPGFHHGPLRPDYGMRLKWRAAYHVRETPLLPQP